MARPGLIALAAAEAGMSEKEFLAHMLTLHATAKGIAAALDVSGSAVTTALERNGFVLESKWVDADAPAVEAEPAL